jgi:hypothetical protein
MGLHMSTASAPKRWFGPCHNCGHEAELQTRYDIGARALCDRCAVQLHTAHVVDLDTVRASRGATSTSGTAGCSTSPSSPGVVLDVGVDVVVGTSAGESGYFEALEQDALKFGAAPVGLRLPNDLTPVQRRVAEDVAYMLGVYEVHDGAGVPQPYSQRFGAKRLGVSHMTVGRALRALIDRGVFIDHGETEPHRHYPRGTRLVAAPGEERQG